MAATRRVFACPQSQIITFTLTLSLTLTLTPTLTLTLTLTLSPSAARYGRKQVIHAFEA
jgi:hypothetical protein